MAARLGAVVRLLRLHQWAKNVIVFLPIVPARRVLDAAAWTSASAAFLALSLVASALYIVNDLVDLEADRRHPVKRMRPFASGALPVAWGPPLAVLVLAAGVVLAFGAGAVAGIVAYAVGSLAYSLAVKRYPVADVFLLAVLYTIRVLIGGVATGIRISDWLLAFSVFLFLSLGAMKRAGEMVGGGHEADAGAVPGRGYLWSDATLVMMLGVSASFSSAVVMALYVQSDVAVRGYAQPAWLWGLVLLVLFWQLRLWLSTSRGHMSHDPVLFALRDRVTWLVALTGVLITVLAARGTPW